MGHDLAARPSKVLITPMGQPPGELWVQSVTDTTFDIATSTAPTADLAIAWHAEIYPPPPPSSVSVPVFP